MTETLTAREILIDSRKDAIPDYEEIEQGIKRRVLDYLHNHREEISIQTVEYGEDYDVLLPLIERDAPWSVEQILEKYSKRLAKTKSHTWWAKTLNIIRDKLPDPSATDALQMTAVHHLTLEEDNQVQGDFEIYDIGNEEIDEDTLKTVYATLQLIDQFAGGLISKDPRFKRVILVTGLDIGSGLGRRHDENSQILGYFNRTDEVVINISGIKVKALNAAVSYNETLSAVLVHEVLGHALEKLIFNNNESFNEHFDYSEERITGEIYTSIHQDISPIEETLTETTQPVREYGWMNPAEDLATTVDGLVTRVMGWDLEKIKNFKSNPDRYREVIIMRMMDMAAAKAREMGASGVVGSRITFILDEHGNTKVRPAQQPHVTTVTGEEYIKKTIDDAYKEIIETIPRTIRVYLAPEMVM